MTTVYIAYPGDNNTRFDRAYYAEHHLPLVMDCWEEYGLRSLAPFYPEHDGKGTVALCICIFADEEAVDASFASPRTAEVMKDITNFTDAKAMQFKAVQLK